MPDDTMKTNPADACRLDRPVGRSVPERDDHALLGRAATVVGIGVRWEVDYGCYSAPSEHGPRRWNPFGDNGDALELLVLLDLELRQVHGASHAGRQNQFWQTVRHGNDRVAASRRAIVKAAAWMADNMPPN